MIVQTQQVRFPVGTLELEGLFTEGTTGRGSVVAHPHPLYGGNMDNNVVSAVAEGLQEAGCATLTFNFRGVGSSTGTHDSGRGERDDLAGALDFLVKKELSHNVLAGYSFGAWVAARTLAQVDVAAVLLISPPLAFWDFHEITNTRTPIYIVASAQDEFCPVSKLQQFLESVSSLEKSVLIEKADHFYFGYESVITSVLAEWFT